MQIELEKISIALSIVLQLYYLGVEKFRACSNNTGPVVCAPKKKSIQIIVFFRTAEAPVAVQTWLDCS